MFVYLLDFFFISSSSPFCLLLLLLCLICWDVAFLSPYVVELLIRSSIEMSPTLSQKMSNPIESVVALEKVQNKLRTSLDTYTQVDIFILYVNDISPQKEGDTKSQQKTKVSFDRKYCTATRCRSVCVCVRLSWEAIEIGTCRWVFFFPF